MYIYPFGSCEIRRQISIPYLPLSSFSSSSSSNPIMMEEEDHKNINDFDDPAEDADEALSLSELPLNEDNELSSSSEEAQEIMTSRPQNRRSSSSETPPDMFEFFSDVSSDSIMCSAEDIIYCGKLVPFKEQQQQHSLLDAAGKIAFDKKHIAAFRRRSESLSQIESSSVTRSDSTKTKLMRNSRSLDYRKLHRPSNSMVSPEHPEMDRNSSVKSVGKSDLSIKKVTKPRWCFLMFGIAKVPAEMDLSDIKSRQFRRNPSTLFPPASTSGGNPSVNRSSTGGKASWRLLKALSCKDHASVAVTASLCAPQA